MVTVNGRAASQQRSRNHLALRGKLETERPDSEAWKGFSFSFERETINASH
jgi:hypothetical protein